MIVSEKSPRPSYSTGISNERRDSTSSTTSPPSYETVVAAGHASAITSDKKKDNDEPLHRSHSNDSSQTLSSSIPHPKGEGIYTEIPPAFERVPVVQNFKAFSPIDVAISGSARSLDKGLPSGIPQTSQEPHPFEQRDISDSDWNRFIQDLRDGTTLPKYLGPRVLVPAIIGIGLGAYLINKAIKVKVRAKKLEYAISLINTWNQSFFFPRRVEVVLMRGEQKLTTAEPIAETQKLKSRNDQSSESISKDLGSTSKEYHCCRQPQVPLKLMVISIAQPA
ncbi:hypothetical protein AGABI2DRAFT_180098 [Agaricus bisporus var. bisporus H97]|uniref:hypothetical protein n=1 Tax=Agaricus bisporus var. bisporus (strain H97 / ATCC MYA-4626 / FGSC 10389) TaxID=936046 RepID=UPI00029F551A|nr:hypothetical protein AGABI2DRAFT_180098 [Agaricus bisporus var. bisporus H97]EKV44624.1 hypothetical protein AGABI2DRAFT_180098 [Agaricus bisporus var. bisporus H97]